MRDYCYDAAIIYPGGRARARACLSGIWKITIYISVVNRRYLHYRVETTGITLFHANKDTR